MYNLIHLTICNSQYFQGHRLPVIQVLVDENTTYRQVKEKLLSHYESVDHIENIDYALYDKAVETLFENVAIDVVPDSFYDIGAFEDNEEHDCYMFFALDMNAEEE